jgi:hypothetical protein
MKRASIFHQIRFDLARSGQMTLLFPSYRLYKRCGTTESPLNKPYLVSRRGFFRTDRSIRSASVYPPLQWRARSQLHKGCFSVKFFTGPMIDFAFMVAKSDRRNHCSILVHFVARLTAKSLLDSLSRHRRSNFAISDLEATLEVFLIEYSCSYWSLWRSFDCSPHSSSHTSN